MSPLPADLSPNPQASRPVWLRALWIAGGFLALGTGIVGIVLPLLPTTPFVLLAAFCFSRGSQRWEAWMLGHPRLGPIVRDWRASRAVPLRAKQLATVMMAGGSIWSATQFPLAYAWLPAVICTGVGIWLWRLPTRRPGGAQTLPERSDVAARPDASGDAPAGVGGPEPRPD